VKYFYCAAFKVESFWLDTELHVCARFQNKGITF